MWWRILLFLAVGAFLAMAYLEYFWRFPRLVKVFKLFAFEGPGISAGEQWAHYCGGTMALAGFRLLGLGSIGSALGIEYQYFLAALFGAIIKETLDLLSAILGNYRFWLHDSFVDISFWLLGGLTAPLLKMYL